MSRGANQRRSGAKTQREDVPYTSHIDSEEQNYEEGQEEMRSAIMQGGLTRVKEILSEGYPVDLPLNDTKTTAIHLAANRGQSEILKLLVSHGARINVRDKKEWTPLMLASSSGSLDCVLALLKERNVDITAKDAEGKDALKFAEQRLVDVRIENHGEESERYKKIVTAIKKRMQAAS
eukprot:TRINITY_DN15084_c0_g3_i3.p1 TRINITY_DN15084_c0_g3~~TRINITY_DN15084_c0_g3_i3.p1  ORF type:complete len:178 (-),score=46.41 TRINITY_DN15084_c0_g3_i3:86-619(-)